MIAINLPIEVIHNILSYDSRFVIRNGRVITINIIPKNDYRYNLLLLKPKIKIFDNNLDYLPFYCSIVRFTPLDNISFSIKVICFLDAYDHNREILHMFNKYKKMEDSYFNFSYESTKIYI